MGYDTRYRLTVIPDDLRPSVLEYVEEQEGIDPFDCDEGNWYDCEKIMKSASLSFPGLLIVDGYGEAPGDVWRKAWLKGELVMDWNAECTPPEPNDELLEELTKLKKTRCRKKDCCFGSRVSKVENK